MSALNSSGRSTALSPLRLFVEGESPSDDRSLTLRDCFEKFWLPENQSARKPATLVAYRGALAHWERRTDNRTVGEIRRSDFVALRDSILSDGLKASTFNKQVRHLMPILRRVSPLSWEDELVLPPVSMLPRVPKLKTEEKLPIELTRKQLSQLYAAVGTCKLYSPACYSRSWRQDIWRALLVLFTLYGARTNELRLMEWSQLDFGKRRIRIKQAKTGKVPDLWLHKVALAHLRKIELLTRPSGRVFGFIAGSNAHCRFYDDWHLIRSAAGLPDLEIRDLRETCASIYHGYSNSAEYVLGHRQTTVTTRHYVSARRSTDRAVKRFPVPMAMRAILEELPAAPVTNMPNG